MRKTIIPAAIVLAAPAVPMQAEELTFEGIQKEISAVSSKIGTYPKAVQDMFASELSNLETKLREVRDNAETTDEQKAIEYATIRDNAKDVLERAKVEEAEYQTAKQNAKNAWDAALVAYTTAYKNIDKLVVPSVKKVYLNTLTTKYPQPAIYTDDDLKALYESIEESEKIKSARNKYTADVEQLVKDAQNADSKEQAEQPKRKTALENSITAVKNNVQPTYNDVYSYVDYGKDGHLATISGVKTALDDIKADVATSRTNWELTAEKAAEYEQKITAQATTLTTTAGDALAAAKAKAEEDAAKLVSDLTKYTVFGPDDYTTAAKEAANKAIQEAITAAEDLATKVAQTDYDAQASVVTTKVTAANTAIATVTSYENNYKAYNNLKKTYETLKVAYDKAAIELSGLKANKEIDDQYYNEANTKLNEVAKMLETFAQTNQSKYEAKDYKGYTESEPGDVYDGVKALLNPDYDTTDEIKQIVIDAQKDNATLATIEVYRTRANGATVKVSFSEVNKPYAEKYSEQATTLNTELETQQTTVLGDIQKLEVDFRTNKVLNTTLNSKVSAAVTALEGAADTASADLNAYVSSKEQVAAWSKSVNDILADLKQIPNPVPQGYTPPANLEKDRKQATDYQSEISKLGTDADDAFNASPRDSQTLQTLWTTIQGKTYTYDLGKLSGDVDSHVNDYKAWLDKQGDVAAYNLGVQYYTELQAALDAAIVATTAPNAPAALGFSDDQTAITALKAEVDKHGTKGHNPNDCIAAMANWKARYDSIQTTIAAHKQAWLDNEKYYAEKTQTLSGILALEETLTDLYTKLNLANQGTINTAITDAQTALNTAYAAQDATSFDVATKQTEILNQIAQLKLQEELDASGIGGDEGAISTVRNQLKTKEGWNPKSNVYGTRLEGLETEFTTFTDGVKYADYQTKHNRIDNQQEGHLKAAILAVATDAEKNYTEYTKQQNAQTAAKAAWANIYSKVGAMYVATGTTNFSGAQNHYQDQLNKCFTVLTDYDTKIDNAYNAGESAKFNTTEYNKAIADNKEAMDGIYKDAYDNKLAYDGQMEKFGKLETYYSEKQRDLQTQINTVIASIEGATAEEFAEELKSLEDQKQALDIAWGNLDAVKTTYIDVLKKAVVEAVNAGGSVKYAYDTEDRAIRSTIDDIISKADGSYNANIVAHNAVVKELFLEAYNAAKEAYNKYTFQIDEYAGYTHALNDNGVSAYAKAIEKAQKDIFKLNTDLVAKYNDATKELSSTTEYVDQDQTHKAKVNELKVALNKAYNDFLDATKAIADANDYAKPLSDLVTDYTNAKKAIERYEIITGLKATPDEVAEGITDAEKQAAAVAEYFTFDGKVLDGMALNAAYTAKGNAGPQLLDDLRAKAKGQIDQVKTAWNNAAKHEANHALANDAKEGLSDLYDSYIVLDYPKNYTDWKDALTEAEQAISDANAAIVTMDYEGLADIKSGITTAKTKLEAAKSIADEKCDSAKKDRGTYQERIGTISSQIDSYRIGDYANYAKELSELITAAETAVSNANKANTAAYNALYQDTELNSALEKAIEEDATTALANLKTMADELVQANQPAGIVATLLAKAQELMPLYNRAEGNATGNEDAEKKCVEIYKDLNTLLTTLGTTDNAEKEKIAEKKATYEAQIESLKVRIIAADVEQQKYNALLEELNGENGVKASLGNVKTYIENSTFKTELNEAFSERIAALDTELLAALTQINIDHANNLCDKTDAVFKGFTAISKSIATLDNDVKTKAGELQTAKDHADMRAANTVNYEAARDAIANADNKLQAEWFNAQESFKDVFTLFNERVKELRSNIATLQDNLTDAYNTAQNEGGVPSDLNTDAYTAKAKEYSDSIANLMTEISDRQAKFEADVKKLNGLIEALKYDFAAIEISDIAAANKDVQDKQAEIVTAIEKIDTTMENFGPNDTDNVKELINKANTQIEEFKAFVNSKTYVPGDITGTGSVDINDTFKILDLILENLSGDELDEKAQKAADMDGDGKFTVADLVQINNLYVYDNKTGQQGSNRVAAAADAEVGSIDMQLDTDRMNVLLDSTTGYSAIQMDVEMPQGVSINGVNFAGDSQKVMVATNTLENGVQRIVIYSTDGSSILNGESSLINLGLAGEGMGIVGIDNIIASTAAGQRHNLMGVTGAYTIVTGIEATETAEGNTSVFDINGMVRKTVQKGVNIVKDAAGKVKKMLMK